MSPEVIARAFDPVLHHQAASARAPASGLSMIYGFARQSGGQVRIYSEPGAGTTVSHLPAAPPWSAGRTGSGAGGQARSTRSGSATVLVVDDETSIRELVCELLDDAGYTVLQAGDGNGRPAHPAIGPPSTC